MGLLHVPAIAFTSQHHNVYLKDDERSNVHVNSTRHNANLLSKSS